MSFMDLFEENTRQAVLLKMGIQTMNNQEAEKFYLKGLISKEEYELYKQGRTFQKKKGDSKPALNDRV
jgi:hypothetical protein